MGNYTTASTVANQNTVKQAFMNSDNGEPLGFFALSNHIAESQFQRVLVALNDPHKQVKLIVKEGKNKNGKAYATVRTPNGDVLGLLSGYSTDTLLTLEIGSVIFTDATPIADVTEILNF